MAALAAAPFTCQGARYPADGGPGPRGDVRRLGPPRLVEGAAVADLFAGSGALGIEAASRGAESVVLVDSDRAGGARDPGEPRVDASRRGGELPGRSGRCDGVVPLRARDLRRDLPRSAVCLRRVAALLSIVGSSIESSRRCGASCRVVRAEALAWCRARGARASTSTFVDPPYAYEEWAALLAIVPAEFVVIESNREIALPDRFALHRTYRYGTTLVTMARRQHDRVETVR